MRKFSWIIALGIIVSFGIMMSLAPIEVLSQDEAISQNKETLTENIETVETIKTVETVDLADITCREFLKFSGEEEKSVITFLHGYISGTQNTTAIDLNALGAASDKITDMCIDNPNKSLLDAFKENR